MPNPDNLRQELPKWNNLPTTAIRIPEVFKDKVTQYAQYLDTDPTERETLLVVLSDDIFTVLKTLSQEQSCSMEDVLRRAIAGELYFWKERQAGGTILIQKPDKEIREVMFR
jgi:hypothetical protein